VRVDLAPDLLRYAREEVGYRPESDVPDHQQVHVAVGGLLAARDGAKHEGPLDLGMCQGGSQEIRETACFQNEAVDLGVEGM
jgi:hypothetical protein